MDRQAILDFLRTNKDELAKKYGVLSIGLFGSYARGEAKPESDIDLVVEMPSSFEKFFGLKSYLEEHLQKKIDLGMKHTFRSFIRESIRDDVVYNTK